MERVRTPPPPIPTPPPPPPPHKILSSMEMLGALESWQIIVQWLVFFEKSIGPLSRISWGLRIPPLPQKKFSEFPILSVWAGIPPPSTQPRARAHHENSLIHPWNKSEGSFYAMRHAFEKTLSWHIICIPSLSSMAVVWANSSLNLSLTGETDLDTNCLTSCWVGNDRNWLNFPTWSELKNTSAHWLLVLLFLIASAFYDLYYTWSWLDLVA